MGGFLWEFAVDAIARNNRALTFSSKKFERNMVVFEMARKTQ